MQFISRPSDPRRPLSTLAFAVALVLGSEAFAQARIQPQRIGGSIQSTPRGGVGGGINRNASGLGNRLGDGTGMGGQTFSWTRGVGAGRSLGSGNRLDANSQIGSGGANLPSMPWVGANGRSGLSSAMGYLPGSDLGPSTRSSTTTNIERMGGARALASETSRSAATAGAQAGSGLTSPGLRNDRFLVAQGLGIFEYARSTTPVGMTSLETGSRDWMQSRVALDRANASLTFGEGNLSVGEDRVVARGQAPNGEPIRYVVSPLRGLQMESMNDPFVQTGLGLYEQARARRDVNLGLMSMDDVRKLQAANRGQLQLDSMNDVLRVKDARVMPKDYLDLVDQVDKAAEGAEARVRQGKAGTEKAGTEKVDLPTSTAAERLKLLQESIDARAKARQARPGDQTAVPGAAVPEGQAGGANDPDTMDGGEADREAGRVDERGKLLTVPEIAEVLRHGRTIGQLGSDDRQRVNELIIAGQELLRKGEYFEAERRFTMANEFARGNPLVEVGIAHAQLGAGLYLSAALTLRRLFEAQPVLIDARYSADLLPQDERLEAATKRLAERIDAGEDAPSYGLVLAYLGHQLRDAALVEKGLEAIGGNERLDAQAELLKAIWLKR